MELQLGAARRGLADTLSWEDDAEETPLPCRPLLPMRGAPVATAFGSFLQRLGSGEDVLQGGCRGSQVAEVGVLMGTDVSL